MSWFRGADRKREDRDREAKSVREDELVAAEDEVARIRERAEKVLIPLERRLRRNFWGETAAAIARKEPHARPHH